MSVICENSSSCPTPEDPCKIELQFDTYIKVSGSGGVSSILVLDQYEYDAIPPELRDPKVLYLIRG